MSNRALEFNGNDRVEIPALGIVPMGTFTIETWVKPYDLSNWRAIRNETTWTRSDVHYQFLNSKLEFSLNGNNPTDQWFSQSFQPNQWIHLAVAYDKNARCVVLYVNGSYSETKNYQSAIDARFAATTFGSWANQRYFSGLMTEMRLWDHVRSEAQIKQLLRKRLVGNEAGLKGYWPMNEGQGTRVDDLTANNKDGVIQGAQWKEVQDLDLQSGVQSMIVGYVGSGNQAMDIWIGGSSQPNVFQPNSIQQFQLPDTQQYMNHVMVNGSRVNSPTLAYNSIIFWDGDSCDWIVGQRP